MATALVLSACGSTQTIQSRSASPATAGGEQTEPVVEGDSDAAPTDAPEDTTVEDDTTVPDAPADDVEDNGNPELSTGVVTVDTIEDFEAGVAFWNETIVRPADETALLPEGGTYDFIEVPLTFYNVNSDLFATVATDDDGKIVGHYFAFDPSGMSFSGFEAAYRLTILPDEIEFASDIKAFLGNSERSELEATFDAGDVLITRTGIDPVDNPVFVMTVVPETDPLYSHADLRSASRFAGAIEGSEVTSEGFAGSFGRDVTIETCELVDGNAQVKASVTNNGDENREYELRLDVYDTDGVREAGIASLGDTDLAPGDSFEWDDTLDPGGGNWDDCQIILLDPGELSPALSDRSTPEEAENVTEENEEETE